MKSVLLLTLPFGPMTRPAIGISLLKAELAECGIACDIRYLNLFFAELVGPETYHELSESIPTSSLFGDWLFRSDLFGPDPERDREYLESYLPSLYPGIFAPRKLQLYLDCRELATPFLDACLNNLDWERYGLVGFTTTFQQTVPSLALARRVKERFPEIRIALGGANCEGEMGEELHRRFPFLDFVFSGESDQSFPALAEAVLGSPETAPPRLPGLSARTRADETATPLPAKMVTDLDALPFPDYADFVEALTTHNLQDRVPVQFLVETSRGCWWGEKQHCTFCGLNGQSMHFRSKSPERVVEELRHLVEHYGASVVWGTDNILDPRYFRTVLPALSALDLKLSLFFETKANLRKEQLKQMKEVGLTWFQPGIESLNTHQLQLMKKGCTALQNIQLLKWVRQYRMMLTWNVLMGFPGETREDYEQMARYCEALAHLQPPSGAHPIRLDRFSPYFRDPGAHGLTDLEPFGSYRYVYPFPDESLAKIAYFFTFRYADGYDPMVAGRPMLEAVARWFRPESLSVLYAIPSDPLLLLCDTRPCATESRLLLSGWEGQLYLYCDAVRSTRALLARAREVEPGISEVEVHDFLARMVERRLILEEDGHWLSLAVLVDEDSDLRDVPDQRRVERSAWPVIEGSLPL
jgi:ribosomal peptide maturation radical SAM protein 1